MTLNHSVEQIGSCPSCRIRANELFQKESAPRVCEMLAAALRGQIFAEGARLFRQGQPVQGLFFIDEGRVKLSQTGVGGRKGLVKVARSGDLIGLGIMLSAGTHRVTAEALERCLIRVITPPDFRDLLQQNPLFTRTLVSYLQRRAHDEPEPPTVAPFGARLASYLLDLAAGGTDSDEGVTIDLGLTLQELAQSLRVSHESLLATLDGFEQRRWLYRQGRVITVLDGVGLQKMTERSQLYAQAD
jgi:CRP/FNR family cyclic AMP-dependent transcriptional regulator